MGVYLFHTNTKSATKENNEEMMCCISPSGWGDSTQTKQKIRV